MSGVDTFNGVLSGCFQGGNGYNKWIPIGIITPSAANPTINFAYNSGVSGRWNVDSLMFAPITATPPSGTYQYWTPGAPGAGGSGSWTTSTPYWNTLANGTGSQGTYIQADLADFTNAAGTVTIDPVNGITTDGGLEFDVSGFILAGGTLTLGSSSSTSGTNIAVAPGSVTINAPISTPYGLCSAYLGTINLGAAVTFPGGVGTVTINTGKVQLNPGVSQSFPSLAGSLISGLPYGVLALGANRCTVGSDNTSTTFAGIISDGGVASQGTFVKTGTGILTLTGANILYGTTTINQGALSIAADSALGSPPASLVANQLTLNGGRLDFTAAASLSTNRGITLGASGGVLSSPGTGTTPTIGGPISGTGSLTVPSGGFDLKASNSFSGGIYVTATPVDTGGNNLCAVRFDAAGSSGTGKIFMSPTTAVNCTLRNFNTSGTVIVSNALEFDMWSLTQTTAQIYLSGGASGANVYGITFGGNINGAAPVIIGLDTAGGSSNPGGEVNLSGSNTLWTGGATLQAGTLGVGSSNALGTGGLFLVPQGPAGVLLATTPLTGTNALTNSIGINTTVSTLTFGGTNSLELSGPVLMYASSTLNITNQASTILSGSISDNGQGYGLTINSTTGSALTLSGSNNYTGGTTVNSGTLIGHVPNSIPATNITIYGGTLQLDDPNAMSTNAVLFVGAATLNLNFTGYQTVTSVNGSTSPGTYGASANNLGGIITGTGFLNVLPPSFSITSEGLDNTGTNVVVCWTSVPGEVYDVMTNTSLNGNGAWVSAGNTNATSTSTCFTLPGGIIGNPHVFVQIKAP
jgi:autotransporter-associated beta strand protein